MPTKAPSTPVPHHLVRTNPVLRTRRIMVPWSQLCSTPPPPPRQRHQRSCGRPKYRQAPLCSPATQPRRRQSPRAAISPLSGTLGVSITKDNKPPWREPRSVTQSHGPTNEVWSQAGDPRQEPRGAKEDTPVDSPNRCPGLQPRLATTATQKHLPAFSGKARERSSGSLQRLTKQTVLAGQIACLPAA